MKYFIIIIFVLNVLELILLFYYLLNRSTPKKLKILLLSCIIILFVSTLYYFFKINIFNHIMDINEYILLIVTIFLSVILNLTFTINELNNKYNKSLNTIFEYEKIIDDQGKKNHEYNNQLMILKGYINKKKKLNEYLDTIIYDHRTGQNFEIRQLSKFPNGGLKELLYYKISEIKEDNINCYLYFDSDATKKIEKMDIKLYTNISKVLGVLIDNAIEGALDSSKKEISLDISKDNNYIVMTISNTYNKNIDINKIGKKGYTSKGKGHGFGLRLVKEIIKKNNKLELVTETNDNNIIQTFLIESE